MCLWQECVKLRANYFCEYPGCRKTEYLNAHHIYSRRIAATRYELDNGMCLCSDHHTLTNDAAHHDPDFKEKIIAAGVRTKALYDKLAKIVGYQGGSTKIDKQLMRIYLIKELAKLKNKLK